MNYFYQTLQLIRPLAIRLIALTALSASTVLAQGGWTKVDDPESDLTNYNSIGLYDGAAWVDVNNDGFIDLFAAPRNLYLNDGLGRFVDVSNTIGQVLKQSTAGCSWADLDNDGDIDCILGCYPSGIFLNDGSGFFQNITAQASDLNNYAAFGCAIGDFNGDRDLDLTFAHAAGFHGAATMYPCRLYYQDGGPYSLKTITGYEFTDSLTSYTVPYWSDYDLDGDMDLFVASGPAGTPGLDYCYRNMRMETGKDTLVRMTTELFAVQPQDGQCYNFIDYDNDGDLDLCLTNYYGVATRFYVNNAGVWTPRVMPFQSAASNLANCWGDYDNDGDLDVIISNDKFASHYFRNNGDGTMSYIANGFTTPAAACGIVNCDYDNDGDLDVFVNGIAGSTGLFRNDTVAGNRTWANLTLVGTASNRSAIGAIVRLRAVINGKPVWQLREVNAQNSFQGQNDLRVHFGLNDATTIDTIIIRWPSGAREVYHDVAANMFYRIVEGSGLSSLSVQEPTDVEDITVFPNPIGDRLTIATDAHIQMPQRYELFNLYGQRILSGELRMMETSINVEAIPNGAYLLRVHTRSGVISRTVIKQ